MNAAHGQDVLPPAACGSSMRDAAQTLATESAALVQPMASQASGHAATPRASSSRGMATPHSIKPMPAPAK